MPTDGMPPPDYSSKLEMLQSRLAGVQAALQAAVRNNDDQEWLLWLLRRRDDLEQQVTKEQARLRAMH